MLSTLSFSNFFRSQKLITRNAVEGFILAWLNLIFLFFWQHHYQYSNSKTLDIELACQPLQHHLFLR